jgi:putative phage-type endonuclease
MTAVGELITPSGRLVLPPVNGHSSGRLDGVTRGEWLAARRMRAAVPGRYCIGSSDVPSILDLDGVDTPVHVYRSKVEGYEVPQNEAMTWGSVLEEPIAVEWCRRNRAVIDEIGLVSNIERPWHQTTIDRRVRECPVYGGTTEECLLEVKNVGFASASRWHADIPDRILAQILHQLYVTGYKHAHYACLVGGNTMKQGIVYAEREEETTSFIVGEVERFRTEYLLTRTEPPWDTTDKAAKLLEMDAISHPDRVGEIGIDEISDVMDYALKSRAAGDAKKELEVARARLAQLADGHEYVTFANELAYRYGATTRTHVNLDRLRERHPEAYADPEVVEERTSHTIYIDKAYKVPPRKKES